MIRRRFLALAASLASYPVFAQESPLPEHWDEQFDVGVVGSGFAGLAAAIEAGKRGLKVLVIEKMESFGGNSAICAGDMAVPGTPMKKRCGILFDSPEVMARDLMREGRTGDPEGIRPVCENALDTWN